jgi:hypothetical protein
VGSVFGPIWRLPVSGKLSWRPLFLKSAQAGVEALVLRNHCMQLVENPVERSFKAQHDSRQYPQIVTYRILFGNYALKLFAEKFEGDPLSTHGSENERSQSLASTPNTDVFADLKMGDG